jgi:glycosyltransferase involved in cell wall biosynthesis
MLTAVDTEKSCTNELVSCGLFLRNEVKYVSRCLESLIAQSYRPIEICVSDNASTDGTVEVLEEFARRYDFVKLKLNHNNVGIFENAKTVMKMSKGQYFFFVGCDDFYEPNFISELIRPMANDAKNLVAMSNTVIVDELENQVRLIEYGQIFDKRNSLDLPSQILSINPLVKEKKMNMFFLGIYRRDFLNDILATDKNVFALGDRFMPFVASICGNLAYVDKNLFFKTKRNSASLARNRDPSSDLAYKKRKSAVVVFHWIKFLLRHRSMSFHTRLAGLVRLGPFLIYFFLFKPLSIIFRKLLSSKLKLKIKNLTKMP